MTFCGSTYRAYDGHVRQDEWIWWENGGSGISPGVCAEDSLSAAWWLVCVFIVVASGWPQRLWQVYREVSAWRCEYPALFALSESTHTFPAARNASNFGCGAVQRILLTLLSCICSLIPLLYIVLRISGAFTLYSALSPALVFSMVCTALCFAVFGGLTVLYFRTFDSFMRLYATEQRVSAAALSEQQAARRRYGVQLKAEDLTSQPKYKRMSSDGGMGLPSPLLTPNGHSSSVTNSNSNNSASLNAPLLSLSDSEASVSADLLDECSELLYAHHARYKALKQAAISSLHSYALTGFFLLASLVQGWLLYSLTALAVSQNENGANALPDADDDVGFGVSFVFRLVSCVVSLALWLLLLTFDDRAMRLLQSPLMAVLSSLSDAARSALMIPPRVAEDECGLISYLTYSYQEPLMARGAKKPLEISDVEELSYHNWAEYITRQFETEWDKQLKEAQKAAKLNKQRAASSKNDSAIANANSDQSKGITEQRPHVSLRRVLWNVTFWPSFTAFLLKVSGDLASLVTPLLLAEILSFMTDRTSSPVFGEAYGMVLAVLIFIVTLAYTILSNGALFWGPRQGMRMRTALNNIIFRKALRLTAHAKSEVTTGKILNLQSKDVGTIEQFQLFFAFIFSAPITVIVALLLLIQYLGVACLAGVGVMIVCFPLQAKLATKFGSVMDDKAKAGDKRVEQTQEILNGIRIVKAYGWMGAFLESIAGLRGAELSHVRRGGIYQVLQSTIVGNLPLLVTLAAFYTFAHTNDPDAFTPEVAFASLTLFNLIQGPLWVLPTAIQFMMNTKVAIERLDAYFNADEVVPLAMLTVGDGVDNFDGSQAQDAKDKYVRRLQRERKRLRYMRWFGENTAAQPLEKNQQEESSHVSVNIIPPPLPPAISNVINSSEIVTSKDMNAGDDKTGIATQVDDVDDVPLSGMGSEVDAEVLRHVRHLRRGEVWIKDGQFCIRPDCPAPTLTLSDCHALPGQLLVVGGSVGAGKSILISCILGEVYRMLPGPDGRCAEPRCYMGLNYAADSSVSVVPQTAWILNDTVRNNITFGLPFDSARYGETIDACCLGPDLDMLPAGDATEIGERGINLSGGQRQRVSIARAVYRRHLSDIFLFDDVLSALDMHVGAALFQRVIGPNGLLKNKTRILATHQLGYAKYADRIIIMEQTSKAAGQNIIAPQTNALDKAETPEEQKQQDDTLKAQTQHNGNGHTTKTGDVTDKGNCKRKESDKDQAKNSGTDKDMEKDMEKEKAKDERSTDEKEKDEKEARKKEAAFRLKLAVVEDGTFQQLIHANGTFARMFKVVADTALSMSSAASEAAAAGPSLSVTTNLTEEKEAVEVVGDASAKDGKSINSDSHKHSTEEQQKQRQSKLVKVEEHITGSTALSVYWTYLHAGGAWLNLIVVLLLVGSIGLIQVSALWLSYWSTGEGNYSVDTYLAVYAIINAVVVVFTFLFKLGCLSAFIRASRVIHDRMLASVMGASVSFFDTTPLGRLLNRFSRDLMTVDDELPDSFYGYLQQAAETAALIIVICAVTVYFVIALVPLCAIFYWQQQHYRTSSRELQRLTAISRSPIFSNFSQCLEGTQTIRALDVAPRFIAQNEDRCDFNNRSYWSGIVINRWLGVRLNFIGSIIVLFVAVFGIAMNMDAGLFGICLSYAISLTGQLTWTVRASIDAELKMNSVERTSEYSKVEPEGEAVRQKRAAALSSSASYQGPHLPNSASSDYSFQLHAGVEQTPSAWPANGVVEFRNVVVRYRPNTPVVLNRINLHFRAGERVGICGRTGSGKSTMMLALLRIVECESGGIFVDDVDISAIALQDLRTHLSIIPQEPVLFTGTIRSNLDPFNKYTDAEVWSALDTVCLADVVRSQASATSDSLQCTVACGGENFSQGQRQLFCLARALLRKSRVLLLDEATASVDVETDQLIQSMIRKHFTNTTILTIAHRIATVLDYDRILVLHNGEIAEFGKPQDLLANPNSKFASMAKEVKH